MSIRRNSLSRFSLNTFNKNNSKNSKIQYFSQYPYYNPTKSKNINNKRGSIYLQRMESDNLTIIEHPHPLFLLTRGMRYDMMIATTG